MLKKILKWIGIAESGVSFSEQIARYLPLIFSIFGVGAVMSVLAVLTDWMNLYAPFSWGLAFLIGVLAIIFAFAGHARYVLWRTQNELLKKSVDPTSEINPLDKNFHNLRIKISDLAHPVEHSIKDKVFSDCELIGPSVLYLASGNIDKINYINCNMIKANSNAEISTQSIITMENCKIMNCKLYNMVIISSAENALQFERATNFKGWLSG